MNDIGRPLKTRIKRDIFRTYMSDTGILTHMLGDTAVKAVYTNDIGFNKGALTENAVAEALTKCGYVPTYYMKNSGDCRMEIDFVVEMFDGIAAIEVKSGKTREAPSIGKVSQHFSIQRRMIFENGNIKRTDDGIEHYPLFASAFFDELDNRPDYI